MLYRGSGAAIGTSFSETILSPLVQCLCFAEVLLIGSAKSRDKWTIPGGGVDFGETEAECAVRETLEEAGVKGKLTARLGYFVDQISVTKTCVFAMEVQEEMSVWREGRQDQQEALELNEQKGSHPRH